MRWILMRFLGTFLTLTLIAPSVASAQDDGVPKRSQEEIASHLFLWEAPVYPAIAQAARVSGDVVVRVEIGPDGLVRSEKFVSGPPMLRQVTLDAVKKWRYAPFQVGNASTAMTGTVVVHFQLNDKPEVHTPNEAAATGTYTTTITLARPNNEGMPDKEIADRFDAAWEACSRLVIAHSTTAETTSACKEAATFADRFSQDSRYLERREAYVYAAIAFANMHDLAAGLPYANKAVEVVMLGHDGNSGSEAAYAMRGKIRTFSGDLKGGDSDLTTAEGFARQLESKSLLKQDLSFHAELLKRLDRAEEAQRMLDEAAQY
jgi:TonB family protein